MDNLNNVPRELADLTLTQCKQRKAKKWEKKKFLEIFKLGPISQIAVSNTIFSPWLYG